MTAVLPQPASRLQLGSVRRIAVLRALNVGDLLCAVPALRALRHAFPDARVTLIGLPWAAQFARRFKAYVDEFASFPGFEGLPEQPADPLKAEGFFAWARDQRYDLALQLHGSGSVSNGAVHRLGARVTIGYHPTDAPCPDPQRYLPYPADRHEIRRCLELLSLLGIEARDEALEFPLSEEDHAEFWAQPEGAFLDHVPYACIHAGGRYPAKRWAPERFATVADALAERGLHIVLTGNAAEAALAAEVRAAMRAPAIHLARDISLGALAVVIAKARLLVANDTGVSHLASAFGTPGVIVFTAADPLRWAPLDTARHKALFVPVDCRPCAHVQCPIGHPCATDLAPERVAQAALELLQPIP